MAEAANHGAHAQTVDTSLDGLLKTPILVSNTFNSSVKRLAAQKALPTANASAARAAQIVDVAVGPGGLFTYSPNLVTINVGDTVRWTFASIGHNVVSGQIDCQ